MRYIEVIEVPVGYFSQPLFPNIVTKIGTNLTPLFIQHLMSGKRGPYAVLL